MIGPGDRGTAARVSRFVLPEIVSGAGALAQVGPLARHVGARRVLVVSEPDVAAPGRVGELHRHLDRAHLDHVTYAAVSPVPTEEEVDAALEVYDTAGCDVLVAIGGRAAVDAAKAVGVLSANGGTVADYDGVDLVTRPAPPLVTVPTTVGDGAGLLQSCTVAGPGGRVVRMLGCALVPEVTVVDPRVLRDLSPQQVAHGASAVLTMSVEAYFSPAASAMTDPHAVTAMRLLGTHLVPFLTGAGTGGQMTALAAAGVHAAAAFTNTVLAADDVSSQVTVDVTTDVGPAASPADAFRAARTVAGWARELVDQFDAADGIGSGLALAARYGRRPVPGDR